MLLEEKADACWGKVLEEQRMGPQGRAYGFRQVVVQCGIKRITSVFSVK